MPCRVCQYYYVDKPCSGKPLKPTGPNIDTQIYAQYIKTLEIRFNQLKRECPCINCLVKVSCMKTCDLYRDTRDTWEEEMVRIALGENPYAM